MPEMPHDLPARGSHPRAGRRTMPAGRALVVMTVCLLVWTVLYAPTLKRASEAQPLGARRTVSLWVLRPLAGISDLLQLTDVTDAAARALGRDPGGAPGGQAPDDLPTIDPSVSVSPAPDEPVTESTPMRRPTADNELRIVVVGDSLAAGLGVYLEREFRPSLSRISKQGRISTGLARLDYFDWFSAMGQIERDFRPDLVIVMIGDNDNQGLTSPGGQLVTPIGSFEWPQGYRDRVDKLTLTAIDGGSHVVWVGLPIVSEKDRWPVMQRQNDIFRQVIRGTPNAVYVDTWDRFATADGGYTPFYRHDGQVELIRATDGLHFNPRGYELVAQAVAQVAVDEFELTPRALNG
ncbi:MAG: GDSL-type esterase/lipase family protein [Actinomycetota bacterium]